MNQVKTIWTTEMKDKLGVHLFFFLISPNNYFSECLLKNVR